MAMAMALANFFTDRANKMRANEIVDYTSKEPPLVGGGQGRAAWSKNDIDTTHQQLLFVAGFLAGALVVFGVLSLI